MWPLLSDVWPWNGARHIFSPWVFICATYEVNWSNIHGIMARLQQKTNDACDLELWSFERNTSSWHALCLHHIWSESVKYARIYWAHTRFQFSNVTWFLTTGWPWPLTFWPGNDARHIAGSWLIFLSNMKRCDQISKESQIRHSKTFERPFGLYDLKSTCYEHCIRWMSVVSFMKIWW